MSKDQNQVAIGANFYTGPKLVVDTCALVRMGANGFEYGIRILKAPLSPEQVEDSVTRRIQHLLEENNTDSGLGVRNRRLYRSTQIKALSRIHILTMFEDALDQFNSGKTYAEVFFK